jgi:hypothetical protein
MKKIIVLCALTAVVVAVMVWRAVAQPSRFGSFTSAPKSDVAGLVAHPQMFVGKTVEVEGPSPSSARRWVVSSSCDQGREHCAWTFRRSR